MIYLFWSLLGAIGEWVPGHLLSSWASKVDIRVSSSSKCVQYLPRQWFEVEKSVGFVSYGDRLSNFCVYFIIFICREKNIPT